MDKWLLYNYTQAQAFEKQRKAKPIMHTEKNGDNLIIISSETCINFFINHQSYCNS